MGIVKNFKKLTNFEVSKLGIENLEPVIVDNIQELRKSPPNIILAEAIRNVKYKQDYQIEQQLVKKVNYVMSLGVYRQLAEVNINGTRVLKPSKIKFINIYKPYKGEDLTNKTLLIWRQGGIGDLLFISPNLKYLKNKYPSCKIILACGPQYQPMVRQWKFIDELIDLPFKLDYIFKSDYHCLFEGVIERTIESQKENAYRLFTKWMGLNLPDEMLIPLQEPDPIKIEKCSKILKEWEIKDPFIIIQMRSSSPIRTPRPQFWKRIIDHLTEKGYKILLTDSLHKALEVDNFIQTLNNKNLVFNFSKFSNDISDTIAMTSFSKLAIGVDSSLLHIAESLKIKNFGIFGPFKSDIRVSTYKYSDWIDCKNLLCSPCFKHGSNLCRNSVDGYVSCYDSLDMEEIFEGIDRNV